MLIDEGLLETGVGVLRVHFRDREFSGDLWPGGGLAAAIPGRPPRVYSCPSQFARATINYLRALEGEKPRLAFNGWAHVLYVPPGGGGVPRSLSVIRGARGSMGEGPDMATQRGRRAAQRAQRAG